MKGAPAAVRMLQLLHVEDEPNDSLLCQIQLENAGLAVSADVVASREGFLEALRTKPYDIILTDYKLRGWSGIEVLRILQEEDRDIPCILLTGSVGEEIAVKCIKLGAADYILKDRPARLPFAITSALEEKRERGKRQEAELSRNRLVSIVESSPDAIIAAAENGTIVNWNPGAEIMFGYSAQEVCGTPLASLFFDDTAGGSDGIQRYETKGTKKNGEVIDLAVTISPIWNAAGNFASAVGTSAIVRDVTAAKHQQRELVIAQKLEAVGQLAGGIAHDFNNLLTVINGYARMLQRKGSADPAKVGAILEAGERGQRLTKQLLMFSRKQITQLKPLCLNSLVLGFLDMLRLLTGAGIELRAVLAPGLASVLADPGQMEQVIMNLVVNARDAMPDGGSIVIETQNLASRESGTVSLSVTDSGVGMSLEVQARIFEPFFSTKEAGRGTGLGLSTSAGIIAHFEGQLRVASELGRGTTFTIQLPVCALPDAAQCMSPVAEEAAGTAGSGTILLAEDDPTVRGFVLSVLQDRGYHVLAAENGSKALELCTGYAGPIHALVTDVVMPEMNGRTLAERAKLLRPGLKVLFVSGYIDQVLRDEDISSPAYAFLEKPFTGEALLNVLKDFCA
jgi:two-component system cell cycle sensor histidine kinase/response regulator CckA